MLRRSLRMVFPLVFAGAAPLAFACSSFGDDPGGDVGDAAPRADASVEGPDGAPKSPDGAAPDAGDPCPVGFGPKMAVVELLNGRRVCVDRTEVTGAAYATFHASRPVITALEAKVPQGCRGVSAATLTAPDASGDLPRARVTFCSAAYYCAASGKRLCGSLADGKSAIVTGTAESAPDPPLEWEAACSNGKPTSFLPWGTTDPTTASGAGCLTRSTTPGATQPRIVGASPDCGPSADGPLDMVGNVWEWVDARRDIPTSNVSYTFVRGGSFKGDTIARCAQPHAIDGVLGAYTTKTDDETGFRCCADPAP